tara:strand:- start:389 stop:571 length:183 start_codon:yes stop_codon:yes gene_type:complete
MEEKDIKDLLEEVTEQEWEEIIETCDEINEYLEERKLRLLEDRFKDTHILEQPLQPYELM